METAKAPIPRRSGVRLDVIRFDFELGRRGLTGRRLAELAGITEVGSSRARRGRPITEETLRKITGALLSVPVVVGADLLIAEPERKSAIASATAREVAGGSSTDLREAV